jgi:hypothetical protein
MNSLSRKETEMGAFATMAAAEARANVLMSTGAALVAHPQRSKAGVISVRILRPCSTAGYGIGSLTADGTNIGGAWDVLTDDAAT